MERGKDREAPLNLPPIETLRAADILPFCSSPTLQTLQLSERGLKCHGHCLETSVQCLRFYWIRAPFQRHLRHPPRPANDLLRRGREGEDRSTGGRHGTEAFKRPLSPGPPIEVRGAAFSAPAVIAISISTAIEGDETRKRARGEEKGRKSETPTKDGGDSGRGPHILGPERSASCTLPLVYALRPPCAA